MAKNNPGGQAGNTNARKHGFYMGALPREQQNVLRRASKIDPKELKIEIDLLRTRIFLLVKAEPANLAVLNLALRTLVRLIALNHGLTDTQQTDIHDSLKDLITSLSPALEGVS